MTAFPFAKGNQSRETAALTETEREKNYQKYQYFVYKGKTMLSLLAKMHTSLKMYQTRPGNVFRVKNSELIYYAVDFHLHRA